MNDKIFDRETPKYRKKKLSSKSKSCVKSKHKHQYEQCLLLHEGRSYRADYCKICGKIGRVYYFETENIGSQPYRRLLDNEEINERYKNLPKYEVDDIFQKYVVIKQKEGE